VLTRILIALGVLALLNFYIALRFINRWPWAGQHVAAAVGIAVAFFLLQILGPFGDRALFPKLQNIFAVPGFYAALDWISYIALGAMSCLFIYTLVSDIVWILWLLITRPEDTINFDRRALISLGAITLGTAALGVGQAVAGPQIRRVDIPLKNLPATFDGFTIAQISDLHVSGMIGRDYTENVVAMTNALKPDLIALTGDFVDGTIDELHDKIAPIADLQAPQGKFYITGNHEYYWGAAEWEKQFTLMGARVLSNEHQVISRGDSSLILAGVTDYSTLHMGYAALACNPAKSLQGAPPGLVKILLAHQPATYHMAHEAGFDLQLSGHTHAGQYFPFNLFIGFFQRYYKGLNRHKNMWVYVNSGTGWWGPPLRTANPSEITLITLRPENA
jgi:predicted MPP superfamily phosphohydrolase